MNNKLPTILFCSLLWQSGPLFSQAMAERLRAAVQRVEADPVMKHAILSLHVENAATGTVIFDRNGQVGLAPASCQKLFTSVAALDLLGPDFRYVTKLEYSGTIRDSVLKGSLMIRGSGDPTLGSWRYASSKDAVVLGRWRRAIGLAGIRHVTGFILADDIGYGSSSIPDGWIWQDIGNYYGAGAWGVNWHENQYEMTLEPGDSVGAPVRIAGTDPPVRFGTFINELRTGAPGSGDNAYIYNAQYSDEMVMVRGTIPLQKAPFVIAGSIPEPPKFVCGLLQDMVGKPRSVAIDEVLPAMDTVVLDSIVSPALDSINYWFLKKSINLYGEALVKTLAYEKTGKGTTEGGVEIVRDFWGRHGIEPPAIHLFDGSGLSPQNRVTTDALVKVLRYARTRPWYAGFYGALPEINGMRMKSGSIGGARSYSGYQSSTDGVVYVFSIIVNNYDGSSGEVVKKLFSILNILKGS